MAPMISPQVLLLQMLLDGLLDHAHQLCVLRYKAIGCGRPGGTVGHARSPAGGGPRRRGGVWLCLREEASKTPSGVRTVRFGFFTLHIAYSAPLTSTVKYLHVVKSVLSPEAPTDHLLLALVTKECRRRKAWEKGSWPTLCLLTVLPQPALSVYRNNPF
ncbi:hypothetical protein M433DRAFT_279846 [Acidomyces richmondensis BFW]|nr:MAG: hypothetical protein FE78DRAFT_435968 [Acidomyces sp. 'richmondensis']KYG44887.1 hypothetical protein M433DRAFT_279846 [Acidomyces richmondensis BFW]